MIESNGVVFDGAGMFVRTKGAKNANDMSSEFGWAMTRYADRQNPALKYQCLLVLNEFTAMGRVAVFAKALGYLAGYNLRCLTVIQAGSQLD